MLLPGYVERQDVVEEQILGVPGGDECHLLTGRVDDHLPERERLGGDGGGGQGGGGWHGQ